MVLSRVFTTVSTNWLREQIGSQVHKQTSRKLRILDTSFVMNKSLDTYRDCYQQGHIPQSKHFDIFKCVTSTPEILVDLPDINCFTDQIQSLGIWPDTHVVAYDRFGPSSSYRTWWMFRLYGHRNISVLDGGLAKWLNDGFEVTTDEPEVERSDITLQLNKNLLRSFDDMMEVCDKKTEQIIDARQEDEPTVIGGENSGIITGAKHIGFPDLFNEDKTMKSQKEIKAIFDKAGIDLGRPVVATCLRGMTACGIAAAAHMLGKENVPVYYGSWAEWHQRAPEEKKDRVDI